MTREEQWEAVIDKMRSGIVTERGIKYPLLEVFGHLYGLGNDVEWYELLGVVKKPQPNLDSWIYERFLEGRVKLCWVSDFCQEIHYL